MNTRYLMIASSIALAAAGVPALFAPEELLSYVGIPASAPLPVMVQLMGALYLGFAAVNWTAKENAIGAVYSRPLSVGNSLHFTTGALCLLGSMRAVGAHPPLVAALVVYGAFAAGFAYLVFGRGAACRT